MPETPTAAELDQRDQLVTRLWQVVELSWKLNSDYDLSGDVEPISDPERDVWSAAALLHSALHRHGIAVRDEYWDLLAAGPVVAAELRRIADECDKQAADADEQWKQATTRSDQRAADLWLGASDAFSKTARGHRARADELDPPSRQEDCR